jgi:hypothetical protein
MSCDYDGIHIDFSVKLDRVVLFMEAQLPWECVQAFGGKLDSVYKKSNCEFIFAWFIWGKLAAVYG